MVLFKSRRDKKEYKETDQLLEDLRIERFIQDSAHKIKIERLKYKEHYLIPPKLLFTIYHIHDLKTAKYKDISISEEILKLANEKL